MTVGNLLINLRLIKPIPAEGADQETINLISKLWSTVGGSDQEGVLVGTLEVYIAAVINIQLNVPEEEKKPAETSKEQAPQPEEQKGKSAALVLSNEQISKIHGDFMPLYLNRKSNRPQKLPKIETEFGFKPTLCQDSIRMAMTSRDKREKLNENMGKQDSPSAPRSLANLADNLVKQRRGQEEYLILYYAPLI